MDNNKSSWIIGLLVCGAVIFFGRQLFPGMLKAAVIVLAIGVLAIAVIIIAVVVIAMNKPKDPKAAAKAERSAVLAKGRKHLVELRRMAMSVKAPAIRSRSEEICSAADRILKELKTRPDDIPQVRQFFNYYLPTMASILEKYVRVESSGMQMEGMAESAAACLDDIKAAMDKQYANLFEEDILDLSVEMEAMTIACRRDGLLEDDGISIGGKGASDFIL